MSVEFEDYSIKVTEALEDAALQFLEEAANEIKTGAEKNSDFAPRSLKGGWKYTIDSGKKEAKIGHPKELAVWMEFGTGEHALKGDGRKGYWIYIEGQSSSAGRGQSKSYATLKEAKKAMAILRSKGLPAHITKGHKPMRMLHNAFASKKGVIERRARQLFGERMN